MSKPMRAKMVVSTVQKFEGGAEKVAFRAVSRADTYPEDGSDENNTYAKFSPQADLTISIANEALMNVYKPGDTFYLDFTPTK